MARDLADYNAFCARLMADNPMIRRISTHVVIDEQKRPRYEGSYPHAVRIGWIREGISLRRWRGIA